MAVFFPVCKFLRSEEHHRTVLSAQTWYGALLDRCAFFLVWGYFIIALPVLPPWVQKSKPTGLMKKIFLRDADPHGAYPVLSVSAILHRYLLL
jgi:hypothetical protein